jgi:L-ascorbate metabolism protein UlaG (beta-lactamase superfamily)
MMQLTLDPWIGAVLALSLGAWLVGCGAGRVGAGPEVRAPGAPPLEPRPSPWQVARHILFHRGGAWPRSTLPVQPRLRLEGPTDAHQARVTFVNHATVLIQWAGLNILTDPVWSERVGPWSWFGPKRARAPGIPLSALPPIDLILISHNHYDHLDLPTLARLSEHSPNARILVPRGDEALVASVGWPRTEALEWWQELDLGAERRVSFVPARHNSGRSPFDANQSLFGGYVLRASGRVLYFAGDTGYGGHFRALRARFGAVDLALLPIGAYLPRETTGAFHLSPEEAVRAQRELGARAAVAIHFGTFQLSAEDFDQPVADLKRALAAAEERPGPFLALPEGHTTLFRFGPLDLRSDR